MGSPLPSLFIGIVAGLRAMTAPAAVAWGIRQGRLDVAGTRLRFLHHPAAPYVAATLAASELVADKLPQTPSRKEPGGFVARIVSGAFCGAVLAANRRGCIAAGLAAGGAGAVLGTLAGYELRSSLAKAAGRDLPIALLEDTVAVAGAAAIVRGCLPTARDATEPRAPEAVPLPQSSGT